MTLNLMRSLILISLPFCCQSAFAPAIAQITPDNTLGAESSVVTPNVNINGIPSEQIDGGAIRDTNLFHSFQELNVGEGRGVYFSNPSGIENILGRVTGINRSNILGTLGVLGNANLFLINPNGIIFGPNARLDLRGSFVGSTADSLMFGNGFDFSATNPQAPPLLTVNIPNGLRFREPAAPILVQGVGQNLGLEGASGSFDPAFSGLRVQPGETLTLAGGNVLLDGGILEAPGGRVELGGLATAGTLRLNSDGSLSFLDTFAPPDVTLTNRAGINVIAGGGGSIAINARNLDVSGESLLTNGIASNQGFDGSQAGNIQLTATEAITIAASRIENNVNPNAIEGNSGNITIIAGSRFLADGAQLSTSTFEGGIAGDIEINAIDQIIANQSLIASDGVFGRIFIGEFGDSSIEFSAPTRVEINSSTLRTTNSGSEVAGDIIINATDEVIVNGSTVSGNGNFGTISIGRSDNSGAPVSPRRVEISASTLTSNNDTVPFDLVDSNGMPVSIPSGFVSIDATDSISITDGSTLQALTSRRGNTGSISLQAENISFDGFGFDVDGNIVPSGAFITVEAGGISDEPGSIEITANSLSLTNRAVLDASNIGGQGDAGNVTIIADNVSLAGAGTTILSSVQQGVMGETGIGNGGNIDIQSQSLFLTGGAEILTQTFAQGFAGNITVNATDFIEISGVAPFPVLEDGRPGGFSSGLFSTTEQGANGQGGTITVTTNSLRLADGAVLSARTRSNFRGGDITVDANALDITGGGQILTAAFSSGEAGSITVNTNGGSVNISGSDPTYFDRLSQLTEVFGEERANFTIDPVNSASGLQAQSLDISGTGSGNITVTSGSFALKDGGALETTTFGAGKAGDINIQASDRVTITTDDETVPTSSRIFSDTGGSGDAGNISLQADESINIDNGFITSEVLNNSEETGVEPTANAGTITLRAGAISLTNGTTLRTTNPGSGFAGDIEINASDEISIINQSTVSSDGDFGRIYIGEFIDEFVESSPPRTVMINSSTVSTTESSGLGVAGDIVINARDQVAIVNQSNITANGDIGRIVIGSAELPGGPSSSPTRVMIDGASSLTTNNSAVDPERDVSILAGDVSITAIDSISITDGSSLQAFTNRTGNAGSITLKAETVSFDESNAFSTVEAGAMGDGGGIEIIADQLSLTNGSQLVASTFGEGNAGIVTIRATDTASFDGVGSDGFSSGVFSTVEAGAVGNGGDININADKLSITNDAVLSSSSERNENMGAAGNINIVADTTHLRNGTISSNTVGGEGNINLRSRALILRRGSEISASASGEVNGGNITINSGVLAALENSDIRANATQGFGGEVRIEAQGVFGTQFREETTDESDITATSELGREFFGIVELNTPDVDPSRGLVTLPVNVVDPASLIADNPCQEGEGSEFTVTGRGGLPSNPGESLRRDAVRVDLVEPAPSGVARSPSGGFLRSELRKREEQGGTRGQEDKGTRGEKPLATSSAEKIVPAQGWVSNEKGEVVLTAYAPTSTTPQRPWSSPNPACPAP